MLEDLPQPDTDLGALHDIGWRAGVEIEHHHGRAADFLRQRKRRVQLDRRQVRHPDNRRQIVGQNVIDGAAVAFAPDGRGLDPVRPMGGGVLFKKELAVYPVGISLQGERPPGQMRHQDRRNASVVVDDLSLGEAGRGIENFIQVGELQLPALNFDHRFFAHAASLFVEMCATPSA